MFFRLIGKLYFYLVAVPYLYNHLVYPMIIDHLLEHGQEYMKPDVTKTLLAKQQELNTPGFRKRQS